jgi:hypothetical protein
MDMVVAISAEFNFAGFHYFFAKFFYKSFCFMDSDREQVVI